MKFLSIPFGAVRDESAQSKIKDDEKRENDCELFFFGLSGRSGPRSHRASASARGRGECVTERTA